MALDLSLKIDVVLAKDLSEDDFKRNYFIPQKPVLIKGLAYQQPAGKKWTIDFFRNTAGDEIVEVFDNRNKDHEKKTSTTADHKILLREFLSIIEKNEYTPLRMFVFNLFGLYTVAKIYFDVSNIQSLLWQVSQYKPYFAKAPFIITIISLYFISLIIFLYKLITFPNNEKNK